MKMILNQNAGYLRVFVMFIALSANSGCSISGEPNESAGNEISNNTKSINSTKAIELKTNMRKLWEDNVTWTRNVILCLVDNVPGTDQAVKRLFQNQNDMGNAIKPYYGDPVGNKFSDLLKEHITIAADVIIAAKAGNKYALDAANKKWYANGSEISEFLCTANPNWKIDEMKMMMNNHLILTTTEAVQRIKKNYEGDVIAYDIKHNEILKLADWLAEGIIIQFPEKFTAEPARSVSN